jgi:hypothetical protein
VVGGVAAVATAGLWTYILVNKDQPFYKPLVGRGPRVRVAPLVGQREGGAVLQGTW